MKNGQTLLWCWGVLSLCFLTNPLFAQDKFTLSGYIRDADNSESLIGANVQVPQLGTGTSSNEYGFYSLTLPAGNYTIVISYLGYDNKTKQVKLNSNQQLNLELEPETNEIEEVVVSSKRENENVEQIEMSQVKLQMQQIKRMPALLGEVDIIKAIQLLPGVQTVGEGGSGFYVRGGAVDQNLILLDEAPVYNSAHLLGFFSVFNSDAIKDVQLYKGGIPANYGGRLSSVLDIRMRDGNKKRISGRGGIGTISSRLTVEGPLLGENSSFVVSGRRTYADLFLKLSSDSLLRQSQLYFYDLNVKMNFQTSEKDRIFLSGYFGRDVFSDAGQFGFNWGNTTATARWNHVYNNKLFSNLTFYYSDYRYFLGENGGVEGFEWTSRLKDLSLKLDYTYFLNPNNKLRFGLQSIQHDIQPGHAKGTGAESIFNELKLDTDRSYEHAAYISNEQKFGDRLSLLYGLRFSMFQNVGEATVYQFDDEFALADSTKYAAGDIYQSYTNWEPRLGLRYRLGANSSIKVSYNRMAQYLHLASNTTSSSPLDVWFSSSPNVKPQTADQVALGYFWNLNSKGIEASVEGYYKKMNNSIDFRDHAELLLNRYLEGELRFGEARSYGLELLLKKQSGRLQGWISYTLARSERKVAEINNGEYYPTKYDKTHDIAVVLSYDLKERLNIAANWVYGTGAAVTLPTGRYEYFGQIVPVYSDRNGERMPAYHRLDIAATLKAKRRWFKNRLEREWVFSIYNVYNRHNAYSLNFVQDEDNPQITKAQKTYLFGIIPSVTANFKF